MKKLLSLIVALFALVLTTTAQESKRPVVQQAKDSATIETPVLKFEEMAHKFGTIKEEDGKVSTVFKFKNEGNAPLILSKVISSCGCTAPTYTKEPIAAGDEGEILVTYNPKGRPGTFAKHLIVYANTIPERVYLTISGTVLPQKAKK